MQKFPLIAAVKAVLAERSKSSDWARVRPPLDPLSPAQRKELAAELSGLEAGATA
jgi:4-hydroxy-tetrahydrodipicolinate synthase